MSRTLIVGSGVIGPPTGKGFAGLAQRASFADIKTDRLEQLRREAYAASSRTDLSGATCFFMIGGAPDEVLGG